MSHLGGPVRARLALLVMLALLLAPLGGAPVLAQGTPNDIRANREVQDAYLGGHV